MDFVQHDPAVVVQDMTKFPWPFPDDTFDEVLASHVLEHLPVVMTADGRDVLAPLLDEVERVLRPGGRLRILVPLAGSYHDFSHAQHYRHFLPDTFTTLPTRMRRVRARRQRSEYVARSTWPFLLDRRFRVRDIPLAEHLRLRARPLHAILHSILAKREEVEAIFEKAQ